MMRTINEISNEVKKTTGKLRRMKVRENFGQKQLRALEDYIGFLGDYDQATRIYAIQALDALGDYCANKTY